MNTGLLLISATTLLLAQSPPIQTLDGKDLPKVAGPLTGTEYLRDPVGRLGNVGIDLIIRRDARHTGFIPGVAVPPGDVAVTHQVTRPAGWQAYQVTVPPGEKIRARVRADHSAWFLVRCLTKLGQIEKGMLQNIIPTGNPGATYINYKKTDATVYFIVDTSEIAGTDEPYTVTFTREKDGKGK